ncbi:MAG: CAP domain-containing protein [Defluviitaleaceae bacterium]|nr:CAP domain-containing protein [Defluviitaleaceae bacterium]MCL2263254.1 CAP domain-containing protein [Defluviitaleaceae bacterium]
MKKSYKKLVLFGITLTFLVCGMGSLEIFAAYESVPTIRMGEHTPMTRDEFMDWRNVRGFRHLNIYGRIYPAEIFFNWNNGQAFNYGKLYDGILYVFPRMGVISENRSVYVPHVPCAEEIRRNNPDLSPVIFTALAPIQFSDDELTAMMERVPNLNPLHTISEITLPKRSLTESEIEAWVAEYNEMGGATAFEIGVVREVNRVRERYGLRPLALDPALMMAARMKTQEFADLQYFAHTSPVHGSPFQTARMLGFEGFGVSETLTQSGSSGAVEFRANPERVVAGMLASTRGHRDILLNPNLYSVGFGSFFSPNSTGRNGNMTHMFYHATKFGFIE